MLSLEPLPSPQELLDSIPISPEQHAFVLEARRTVVDILNGDSQRILIVVGPCSIHDTTAAKDFAKKLRSLSDQVSDRCYLVMRSYFEKPRTGLGWKGLLYDPSLDGSDDVLVGLRQSRQLLLDLANLGVPAATEFLDLSSTHYFGDLITWGSIGSRTTESQPHRLMVSANRIPTGFKNSTDGNLDIAVNALLVAESPHSYMGMNHEGRVSIVRSKGNGNCHIVLRGGAGKPNYDPESVHKALLMLRQNHLRDRLIIDCSHDNSGKDHHKQVAVFQSTLEQILQGQSGICGMILESNLKGGRQPISPRAEICSQQSITDACLDWETTESLILQAYEALGNRIQQG